MVLTSPIVMPCLGSSRSQQSLGDAPIRIAVYIARLSRTVKASAVASIDWNSARSCGDGVDIGFGGGKPSIFGALLKEAEMPWSCSNHTARVEYCDLPDKIWFCSFDAKRPSPKQVSVTTPTRSLRVSPVACTRAPDVSDEVWRTAEHHSRRNAMFTHSDGKTLVWSSPVKAPDGEIEGMLVGVASPEDVQRVVRSMVQTAV